MYQRHPHSGVGILPLLLVGAGAAGMAAAGAVGYETKQSYESGWIDNLLQVVGLKSAPTIGKPSAPALQPPPAPQTAGKLKDWTSADLAEASAQRGVQFQLDSNYWRSITDSALANSSGDPKTDASDWSMWALVAAGAAGFVLLSR